MHPAAQELYLTDRLAGPLVQPWPAQCTMEADTSKIEIVTEEKARGL